MEARQVSYLASEEMSLQEAIDYMEANRIRSFLWSTFVLIARYNNQGLTRLTMRSTIPEQKRSGEGRPRNA